VGLGRIPEVEDQAGWNNEMKHAQNSLQKRREVPSEGERRERVGENSQGLSTR